MEEDEDMEIQDEIDQQNVVSDFFRFFLATKIGGDDYIGIRLPVRDGSATSINTRSTI